MDIVGFENYLIYSDGRVYNKKRNTFIKIHINHKGYKQLRLTGKDTRTTFVIHRLVAIHYIPNPDNKKCVDHKDRNRLNNDISNLRWVTNLENCHNRGDSKNNTSGHKNIRRDAKYWRYEKQFNNINYKKRFKSLTDCLCYKFIMTLKFKSQIITTILPLK